jgi:hypothetical protein
MIHVLLAIDLRGYIVANVLQREELRYDEISQVTSPGSVADNWVAEKLPQSGRLEPQSPKITLFAFFFLSPGVCQLAIRRLSRPQQKYCLTGVFP